RHPVARIVLQATVPTPGRSERRFGPTEMTPRFRPLRDREGRAATPLAAAAPTQRSREANANPVPLADRSPVAGLGEAGFSRQLLRLPQTPGADVPPCP